MSRFGRSAGFVFGMGMMGLTAALAATGCAATPDDVDPSLSDVAVELVPEGKPGSRGAISTTGPKMTCVQATGGCVPMGYRGANCTLSGLKPNSNVITCVKARCPAVYGYDNGKGESCFTTQNVAQDGTAYAFFAVAPGATYSFTTYTTSKGGAPLASASASVIATIGEGTQCGGTPSACY